MAFIENPAGSGLYVFVDGAPTENPTDLTSADLFTYVSANTGDDPFVEECFDQARALVNNLVGSSDVPASVLGRAYLEAGSELFHRRQAPNGISQFADLNGAAVRVARDPLVGVYPIVQPFMGAGIA